jgi:ATP-dependent DNA helicase RecG
LDLVEILKRREGKTLELERDLSSPDGSLRKIVALANAAGGSLLVGVADRSRHVRGSPTRSTWRSDCPTSSVTGSAHAS